MKYKKFFYGISLLFISICLMDCFAMSCANLNKEKTSVDIKKVKGYPATFKVLPNTIDGFGTLSYQKKVDVSSTQDAVIQKIYFREGNKVNKGDVIIVLENPQIILAVERAENSLEQAEAALQLANSTLFETELQAEANLLSLEKLDYEMALAWKDYYEEERKQKAQEILYEAGGLSDEAIRGSRFKLESQHNSLELAQRDLEIKRIGFRERDLIAAGIKVPENNDDKIKAFVQLLTKKAQAEITAAIAQRDAAKKELKSCNIAKSELTIRSPINGILAAKYLEEGESVKKEDKLATMMDSDYLYAVIPVRETDVFKIQNGMSADVSIDGINKIYTGSIDLISPYADSKSFTFSVRVLISKNKIDDKYFPKPGMFTRVVIDLGNPRTVLLVKESSVFDIQNNEGSIFIVNGNLLVEKKVVLGDIAGDEFEIKEGLSEGEIAVLHRDSDLKEGDYVTVIE
ncbi:MAG: efflux RND transporter periplasmic adaptor subunit [Spirochaetaceae bacterium]|jgi:RND family efflux transporter MFP subunit|nr:efflux RND transporter periplasmic adaptor subunit [Spirochaetaceae bacterium]